MPSDSSPAWIGEITRMARQASSKPDSGSPSTATIGFEANLHQSRTLATLRDTLLPKLLSGEISVDITAP